MMADDDEELRQTILGMGSPADGKHDMPPHVKEKVDEINKAISNLKYGKRFDSLIVLNQIIWSVQEYE